MQKQHKKEKNKKNIHKTPHTVHIFMLYSSR